MMINEADQLITIAIDVSGYPDNEIRNDVALEDIQCLRDKHDMGMTLKINYSRGPEGQ